MKKKVSRENTNFDTGRVRSCREKALLFVKEYESYGESERYI